VEEGGGGAAKGVEAKAGKEGKVEEEEGGAAAGLVPKLNACGLKEKGILLLLLLLLAGKGTAPNTG
jgi:hypothetical protein